MKYGLIGEKLSHSFSKEIHEALTDYEYELCELAPEELADFLGNRDFCGINVTIPYKEKVIPFLDEISLAARKIGAVNTIKNVDGKLVGDNTDFYGMREMIVRAGIELDGKKVLILGTGGTSKTARAVAADLGAQRTVTVSRTPSANTVTYEEALKLHSDADIIINTTPLGMFPNAEGKPLELEHFDGLSGVIDVVYNPLRTRLVIEAEDNGIPAIGGLTMLILQAARAAEIFLGEKLDDEKVERVIKDIYTSKENIVLIGMPGCGKTTVGNIIAEKTGRTLVDTDAVITEMTGCAPSKIIKNDGEKAFRDIETEAVRKVSKSSGVVIATGGGVVTREENISLLRQNGRLIYLHCCFADLVPTQDRPLSATVPLLRALYEVRHPLYENSADCIVDSSHDNPPTVAAEEVLNQFSELIA
ncbi:MAG: shikimate kinase [Eubacteriales bacterium]